ncbi:MAG TPA: alpha-L-arabinofuranosidase C-terminal domain-containing protein [Chitinophagaceae bacterium]|nr:alpha-L-arabinofuranosidase C-terminal domain-containing protein [Chitinophagaceae bacterium]
MLYKKLLVVALCSSLLIAGFAQDVYTVNPKQVKAAVQPTMWGLFFEDINRSGDGGIYAELVKNRSFDFPDAFMGWHKFPYRYGKNDIFQVINRSAANPNNPKYLQVTISKPEAISLSNESFGGLSLGKDKTYTLAIVYKVNQPGIALKAELVSGRNQVVGTATIQPSGNSLQTATATMTAADTTVNGKLRISFEGTGQMNIESISLFPTDTWMNRPGGMRTDLVQKLADIKPGFIRFPGGCIVEGQDIDNRYQWKNTIGPLDQRKLNFNSWNNAVAKRPLPDYFQSYGLGFFEYFQLCADMKTEPLPILNCGLSCQFGAGEVIPVDQIDPYVQDALDLVEFANGDASTTWGRKRIEMGHAAPFDLKLLGIGNENWGPQYAERLRLFTRAIKARYPYIQIIASTGYSPNDQFKYIDSVLRKDKVDIIDEHYYQTAPWFLMNAGKYDNYDRKGPRIFLGEYACHSVRIGSTDNKNTQLCALAEAAFMTGLERNADVVTMAAYAPLFAHVKDWQWTPNLIWFDNTKSYATPSYYVQQLFSLNKGTDVVPITLANQAISGQDSIWASAVIDNKTQELIIKLVNPSGEAKKKEIAVEAAKLASTATITVLKSGDPQAVNSLDDPSAVAPVTTAIHVKGKKLSLSIAPYSFNVVRIKLK